jgi:hypothetical protein
VIKRIIINIGEGITEEDATRYVANVISGGRISQAGGIKHFCWMTTWKDGMRVATARKKKGQDTDSFNVWREDEEKA